VSNLLKFGNSVLKERSISISPEMDVIIHRNTPLELPEVLFGLKLIKS
jgi:hypothetical protein